MSFGRSGSKLAAASSWPGSAIRRPPRRGLGGRRIDKHAEADREAVPAVDDIDHQRELHLLLLA